MQSTALLLGFLFPLCYYAGVYKKPSFTGQEGCRRSELAGNCQRWKQQQANDCLC